MRVIVVQMVTFQKKKRKMAKVYFREPSEEFCRLLVRLAFLLSLSSVMVGALAKRVYLHAVMGNYLVFAYLLYNRWAVTELSAGHPVLFPALVGGDDGSFEAATHHDRPTWSAVLTPLWVADGLTVVAHATLLMLHYLLPPRVQLLASFNSKIEHLSALSRALLYAAFKVLLLRRLSSTPGAPGELSWGLTFSPIYIAALLQFVLHSCKEEENDEDGLRPRRRPGLGFTLDDILALNVSLHLSGGARSRALRPDCTPARAPLEALRVPKDGIEKATPCSLTRRSRPHAY
jgi:hypothetical protein